jgi:hypothetical protein
MDWLHTSYCSATDKPMAELQAPTSGTCKHWVIDHEWCSWLGTLTRSV